MTSAMLKVALSPLSGSVSLASRLASPLPVPVSISSSVVTPSPLAVGASFSAVMFNVAMSAAVSEPPPTLPRSSMASVSKVLALGASMAL